MNAAEARRITNEQLEKNPGNTALMKEISLLIQTAASCGKSTIDSNKTPFGKSVYAKDELEDVLSHLQQQGYIVIQYSDGRITISW